jgi:hypothetical protein
MIERFDNLIHHPRTRWLPRPLTSWVCDLMDRRLGLSWDEIRRSRHGRRSRLANPIDWFSSAGTSSTIGDANVTYNLLDDR